MPLDPSFWAGDPWIGEPAPKPKINFDELVEGILGPDDPMEPQWMRIKAGQSRRATFYTDGNGNPLVFEKKRTFKVQGQQKTVDQLYVLAAVSDTGKDPVLVDDFRIGFIAITKAVFEKLRAMNIEFPLAQHDMMLTRGFDQFSSIELTPCKTSFFSGGGPLADALCDIAARIKAGWWRADRP